MKLQFSVPEKQWWHCEEETGSEVLQCPWCLRKASAEMQCGLRLSDTNLLNAYEMAMQKEGLCCILRK